MIKTRNSVLAVLAALSLLALGACGDDSDEAATSAGSTSGKTTASSAEDVSSTSGFLGTDSVTAALDQFKEKAGPKANFHSIEIKPDEIAFEYTKDNKTADGFLWTKDTLELEPIEVDEFGTGEIPSFDVSQFDPAAPGKINDALNQTGYELASMNLQNVDTTNPRWKIQANKGNTYGVEFVADTEGGSLKKVNAGAQAPKVPSASEAASQVDCLQKAGTDVAKVQQCTK